MQQVLEYQVVGRGSDSELIKEFRRLNSFDFEGSMVLGEAENWLRCIEITFKFMNMVEDKKVLLAYYNLKEMLCIGGRPLRNNYL